MATFYCVRRFFSQAIVLITISLLIGCANNQPRLPLLDNIKDRFSSIKVSTAPTVKNIQQFNTCMAPLSSKLKPGFIALIKNIKGMGPDAKLQFSGNFGELGDEHMLIGNHNLHPAIDAIFDKLLTDIHSDHSAAIASNQVNDLKAINQQIMDKLKQDGEFLKQDTQKATTLANDYLVAYFKKSVAGIVSNVLKNDKEKDKLLTKTASLLNLKADDPKLEKVFALLNKQLGKASNKFLQSNTGFIGRDGTLYNFPGLNEGTSTSIDHSQIGADTIRIILEALRDTYAPLPVLPESTAAKYLTEYVISFDSQGQAKFAWQFDHQDPSRIAMVSIDAEHFQTIEAHAKRAEAFVASTVGKVIRGGSWGSLNNEAVAKLIETVAGVVARQLTERAEWCLHAQLNEQPLSQ